MRDAPRIRRRGWQRDPEQPLDTPELLAVSRVVTLFGTARVGTTGQLP